MIMPSIHRHTDRPALLAVAATVLVLTAGTYWREPLVVVAFLMLGAIVVAGRNE